MLSTGVAWKARQRERFKRRLADRIFGKRILWFSGKLSYSVLAHSDFLSLEKITGLPPTGGCDLTRRRTKRGQRRECLGILILTFLIFVGQRGNFLFLRMTMSMSLFRKKESCKSVLFARLAADQHGLLIHVVNKFKPSWLLLSKQINDVFLLRSQWRGPPLALCSDITFWQQKTASFTSISCKWC